MKRRSKTSDWQRGAAGAAVLLLTTVFGASCGGSLYRVKPVVDAPAASTTTGAVSAGGVNVRAVPLLRDEEGQELFEANLLLAGLLPVRVEIGNESTAPLSFKRVRFRLRDQAGKEWKYRTHKQAVSSLLDANEIYLYNPNSRAAFERALGAHALDTATPLAVNQSRRGLIFFRTPKKEAVEGRPSLTLTIEGLPQPAEVRLN